MLLALSSYPFSSIGPDSISCLHDKKIPELAKQAGWDHVALADERTMAGTLLFLSAARKADIKASAGIRASLLNKDQPSELSVILLAMNQAGFDRIVRVADIIGRASSHTEIAKALKEHDRHETDRPDIICGISLASTSIPTQEIFQPIITAFSEARTGCTAALIEPGGETTRITPKTDRNTTITLAENTGLPIFCLQTAHLAAPLSDDKLEEICKFSTIKATAQQKIEITPRNPAYIGVLPTFREDFTKDISPALIKHSSEMRLDREPTLPHRLGLKPEDNADEILRDLAETGLTDLTPKLVQKDINEYWDRLNNELSIIAEKGFSNYFLIIRNAIHYAKKNNIPVGPGRGSVAGSVVAFATGITTIDPVRYSLLFERFINPERTSLPDIDTDFCSLRRHEVFDFLGRLYGDAHVAHIATYADAKTRSTIRDCGRITKNSGAANDLIRILESSLGSKRMDSSDPQNLHDILQELSRIASDEENYSEQIRTVAEISSINMGMPSTIGVHAGGIVLSDKPISDWSPLQPERAADNHYCVQLNMETVEMCGLVKFDFLSLNAITAIRRCLDMIKDRTGKDINIEEIPDEDEEVFRLISSGKTKTIFQLETAERGIGQAAKDIGVTSMDDIIALVALYRPGPLEYIPLYGRRKSGEEEVVYPHPSLIEILKDTYGIIIYQEQIMQIARVFAGYSLGQADILRKAVGKKKLDLITKERQIFIERAINMGREKEDAETIFDFIIPFARYGFNKSHAAAYAKLAWQTAWLRCHYPCEWFAAHAETRSSKDSRTGSLMTAKFAKVPFAIPSLTGPIIDFSTRDNPETGQTEIQIPMSIVSETKQPGLLAIRDALAEHGQPKSFSEFLSWISTSHNSTIAALIMAGTFDSLSKQPPNVSRKWFITILEDPRTIRKNSKRENADQIDMISMFDQGPISDPPMTIGRKPGQIPPFSPQEAEDIQNSYLDGLTSPIKGANTQSIIWLRQAEGLLPIPTSISIAKRTPAFFVAFLSEIKEQAHSIERTGQRILEAVVSDETGSYTFDIANGTSISPSLIERKSKHSTKKPVIVCIGQQGKDALLSERPVILSIKESTDPITDENRKWPVIMISDEYSEETLNSLNEKTLEIIHKRRTQKKETEEPFSLKSEKRRSEESPIGLIVTPSMSIHPYKICKAVRDYGIEKSFGGLKNITEILI